MSGRIARRESFRPSKFHNSFGERCEYGFDEMSTQLKAYLVGGGIGSLAAAAFMIRDGGMPGGNLSILGAAPLLGGSLDGAGEPAGAIPCAADAC